MDKSNHSRSSPAHDQFLRDLDVLRRCAAEHPVTGKLSIYCPSLAEKETLKRLAETLTEGYCPAKNSLLRLWGVRG